LTASASGAGREARRGSDIIGSAISAYSSTSSSRDFTGGAISANRSTSSRETTGGAISAFRSTSSRETTGGAISAFSSTSSRETTGVAISTHITIEFGFRLEFAGFTKRAFSHTAVTELASTAGGVTLAGD
jgi:hypothetical protein